VLSRNEALRWLGMLRYWFNQFSVDDLLRLEQEKKSGTDVKWTKRHELSPGHIVKITIEHE
jgi:hypothetical protein